MKKIILPAIFVSFIVLLFSCSCSNQQASLTYTVDNDLSFEANVDFNDSNAAWNYADKITSHVESSMTEMKNIFSKKSLNIVDCGAQPSKEFTVDPNTYLKSKSDFEKEIDLAKNNTKSIYKAICEISKSGGGSVVVPAIDGQVFYTSALHLEDNVNLYIEKGATLKFTTDTNLYAGDFMKEVYGDGVDNNGLTFTRYESVELMNYSPFIYAYGKKNIAISGSGTIDGSATKGDQTNPETFVWHGWRLKRTINGVKDAEPMDAARLKLFGEGQKNIDVAKRQYGQASGDENSGADDGFLRPTFVQPYNCQNVLISGVNVKASPMWEINPVLCDTVLVEGLNINTHMNNNDGCDPECTSNIVIRNNVFDVGDDCIAIKSGRNGDGLRINRPSYNMVITNNTFKDGHGGVTIGSEITSGVKNIFAKDNLMDSDNLEAAYRFKTNYIRGGDIKNIFYNNDKVKMVQPNKPVVLVDLNYDISKEVQMMESIDAKYKAYIPSFSKVVIQDLNVNDENIADKGGKYAFQLKGFSKDSIAKSCTQDSNITDCYIKDFVIKNSRFNSSNMAFDLEYVDGLSLDGVTFNNTFSQDILKNCKNLNFNNCKFVNTKISKQILESIEGTNINNCTFD